MDPRDFHALALRLASGPGAAEYRSAISRSYYAAFNVGATTLRGLGFPIGKGAAHGEVQKCLWNAGDAAVSTAVSVLDELHSRRNRADYQLERADAESAVNAQAAARLSGEAIETIDRVFSGPPTYAGCPLDNSARAAVPKPKPEGRRIFLVLGAFPRLVSSRAALLRAPVLI